VEIRPVIQQYRDYFRRVCNVKRGIPIAITPVHIGPGSDERCYNIDIIILASHVKEGFVFVVVGEEGTGIDVWTITEKHSCQLYIRILHCSPEVRE
jgi:hypothetical protein